MRAVSLRVVCYSHTPCLCYVLTVVLTFVLPSPYYRVLSCLVWMCWDPRSQSSESLGACCRVSVSTMVCVATMFGPFVIETINICTREYIHGCRPGAGRGSRFGNGKS